MQFTICRTLALWCLISASLAAIVLAPFSHAKSASIRICDDSGCSMRDSSSATFHPTEDTRSIRQPDPDPYRGESLSDLQTLAVNGDPHAAYKLGIVYTYGLAGTARDLGRAFGYFDAAAGKGHHWAEFRLAQILSEGHGVRRDPQRSLQLMFSAASAGLAEAAYCLGILYLNGKSLPRDSTQAAHWLTIAAENGVPEAQYNLSLLSLRGEGMPQAIYDGWQWMLQSARGGYVPAQKYAGRLYMTGFDSMRQDLSEARTWLTLAAEHGDPEARKWLIEIDQLQKEQLEYARQLQMQEAKTATLIAGALLAAALQPPPTYIIAY